MMLKHYQWPVGSLDFFFLFIILTSHLLSTVLIRFILLRLSLYFSETPRAATILMHPLIFLYKNCSNRNRNHAHAIVLRAKSLDYLDAVRARPYKEPKT